LCIPILMAVGKRGEQITIGGKDYEQNPENKL
jgi:hypothetical protein